MTSKATDSRAQEIFEQQQLALHSRTDHLFARLMIVQWLAGIAAAVWISPLTWSGAIAQVHPHVWAAVLLGGAITSLPVFLALSYSGKPITRLVIAVGQMSTSALLIHLTGGRIETHFHVFGSLAFLACYRDWRVLGVATLVVGVDHGIRGWFWPESVYGVLSGVSLRFFEHVGWVVFENVFLLAAIRQSLLEMQRNAMNQAELEETKARIESEVRRRTDQLRASIAETAAANERLAETNEMLKQRNAELDQFTYVASHDLQEPVRKLVSFSTLLEQDIDCDLNEDAQRDLEFITDAAHRMRNLVQALLELSRVGRGAVKHDPVPLDACVEDALFSLELRIEETGAKILRDPLPTVNGDATVLTQLYQNLISNALKFTSGQQPEIHLTCERDDESWVLGVRDNGIGMKPDQAYRIFEPFQRLHNRGEYEGTGIGLSICRKAVQLHNGTIWVESDVGQGAHFRFTLPAEDAPPIQEPTDAEQTVTAQAVAIG